MKYKFLTKSLTSFFFPSCDEDGNEHTIDEQFSNKHPAYPDPSTSPAEQKMTVFTNVPKSHAVHFNTHRVAGFAPVEPPDTPCSASPSAHFTTVQERMDLEMSVLRRQEAVLKLQEEYYTLKIKLMRKQMEEPFSKD